MKDGLDYFPLDTQLEDSIELIEAEFGLTGFAVVVKLFQKIYGGLGYYCEWTNDVALLFGSRLRLGGNAVSEIVGALIRRGIFDSDLYDRYHILTSAGIQKRYFEAVSRRKKIKVNSKYLLVQLDQKLKDVYIFEDNVDILEKNTDIFKQSKVKESKVEESRVYSSSTGQKDIVKFFEEAFGTTATAAEKKILKEWEKKIPIDNLKYAITEAVKANVKQLRYIEKIVKRLTDSNSFSYQELENIMRGGA